VRKVEGEIEAKTMEDGRRRKERGVGEREMVFFWIIIPRVTIYFRVTVVVWFLIIFFTFFLF
jgi:hypothetical protein